MTHTHTQTYICDGDFTGENRPTKAEGTFQASYECGRCEEQKMSFICGREEVLGVQLARFYLHLLLCHLTSFLLYHVVFSLLYFFLSLSML